MNNSKQETIGQRIKKEKKARPHSRRTRS